MACLASLSRALHLTFATCLAVRMLPAAEPTPFQTACLVQAAELQAAERWAFVGSDGYHFLTAELQHLGCGPFWGEAALKVSKASKPEWADPLPAILDFQAQLNELDIELLLVPVPPKAALCANRLPAALAAAAAAQTGRVDFAQQAFYTLLRAQGVAVLDLTDTFRTEQARAGAPSLYCQSDSHWSPWAGVLAARAIAAQVRDRPWLTAAAKPGRFTTDEQQIQLTGDLARMLDANATVVETQPLREVKPAVGADVASAESRASPIVLLGDSHCLVFHVGGDLFATGGGLSDQLAAELQLPIDVLGTRGSGATPARQNLLMRSQGDPAYLKGKKLVVWCFAAREFTQAAQGWRKLPVRIQAAK